MAAPIETPALPLGLYSSQGFDATTVILIVLAAVAGYLVYDFIREAKGRSTLAIIGAVIGHLLLVLFLSLDVPGRLGCGVEEVQYDLIEFEVAQIEPEPEPEPEPPKQEEPPPDNPEPPEMPQEIKPKEPPPKKPPKQAEPPKQEPVQPQEAAPTRIDLSSTVQNGNSGVVTQTGSGTSAGSGKPGSKGTKKGPVAGDPEGEPDGAGAKWQPRSELFIKEMPKVVKVPKIECPATKELGVSGDVVVKVQITAEGKIRDVKLIKGIGQGCDQVAIKALKQARFKPAVGTNGKPVDFELRYEYAFTVND